jgi:hypothetical protein
MRRAAGVIAAWIVAASVGWTAPAAANPTFNLTFISGTSAQAQTAFTQAAAYWSSQFADNVTINLNVGTGSLGGSVLGQAASYRVSTTYSAVRAALAADATTSVDAQAVAGLATGSTLKVYMNYTSDNPNGSGSATPYLDTSGANNTTINLTSANAKALGFSVAPSTLSGTCSSACDAFIEFNSGFSFDYDRSNGISSGSYDFVGLAIHEIGHVLGFISGVDILDQNSTGTFFTANSFVYVSPLDLFRCSTASAAAGANVDFTAGTATKNFSLDGCATSLGTFSTGVVHGDGRQASHWKDNLGLGIMDPTAGTGELLTVTALDLTAFDAIGWTPAPEPGALALGGAWLAGIWAARRRRSAA